MKKLLIALVAVTIGYTTAFAANGRGRGAGGDAHEPNAPKTRDDLAKEAKKDNQGGTLHQSRTEAEARANLVAEAANTGVLKAGQEQQKAAETLDAALKDSSIGLTKEDMDLLYSRRNTQDGKYMISVIMRLAVKGDLKGILTFYKKEYVSILKGKEWSADAFKQLTEMLGRADKKLEAGDVKTGKEAIEESLVDMKYDKTRIEQILRVCFGL